MTAFQDAVIRVVQLVPAGRVVSYGQVAVYVGTPRAARQVGWALRSLESAPDLPWWRVVNNAGLITIKGNAYATAQTQAELLRSEGVEVDENFSLAIEDNRFRPTPEQLQSLLLDPDYIKLVLDKYM